MFLVVAVFTVPTMSLQDTSEDMFRQCLISRPSASLGYCLGVGTISKLQNWENDPKFDVVDGVTFARDEQQFREAYNFVDRDPSDFRWVNFTTPPRNVIIIKLFYTPIIKPDKQINEIMILRNQLLIQ